MHLLCTKYQTKHFMNIIIYNLQNDLMREVIFYFTECKINPREAKSLVKLLNEMLKCLECIYLLV